MRHGSGPLYSQSSVIESPRNRSFGFTPPGAASSDRGAASSANGAGSRERRGTRGRRSSWSGTLVNVNLSSRVRRRVYRDRSGEGSRGLLLTYAGFRAGPIVSGGKGGR